MLWLLLSTAAHAQDSASSMPDPGTILGGGALAAFVIRELIGLVKSLVQSRDSEKAKEQPAENAAIAALDARLKSAETGVADLQRRADEAQVSRTQYDERIRALRREFDGHCAAAETARAADRAETAARLDRIADAIDTRR